METQIINLLSIKSNISMNYESIKGKINTTVEELNKALLNLENNGTIYKSKNGRYSLTSRTSLRKGIVRVTAKKGVIVELKDGE